MAEFITTRKHPSPKKEGCFPVCNVRGRKGRGGPPRPPLRTPWAEGVGYRIPVGIYVPHLSRNQGVATGQWQLSLSGGCYRFSPPPRQDGTQADPEAESLGDYHSGELPLPILPTPRRLGNNRSFNATNMCLGFDSLEGDRPSIITER